MFVSTKAPTNGTPTCGKTHHASLRVWTKGDPSILSAVADDVHYEKYDHAIEFELNHEFKPYR